MGMRSQADSYEVIVIGAGHAGCEAALAAARIGAHTLMVTPNLDTIAAMPCNCSIGGPGKSQLVAEIDALGGAMGYVCDQTYTHARILNASKGPAVQSLRCQADKAAYRETMKELIEAEHRIALFQDVVTGIVPLSGAALRVLTQNGATFEAASVVVATGTFLNGVVHIGEHQLAAGRAAEMSAVRLTDSLRELGLEFKRFKTGTVPRLRLSSLDIDRMRIQPSDARPLRFSVRECSRPGNPLLPCYVTHTNERTHEIILRNLERSALHAGNISGSGPRYCPSIETKLVRFPDKSTHPLFMEQEGWRTEEVYGQGLYNSMPYDVQVAMVRSIAGLEHAEIMRPGYAIEYDACDPRVLEPTLGLGSTPGIFLAGQINGTSGYEEAAAQGLIAGANAALHAMGTGADLIIDRTQGYIGVMIDDLLTRGAEEPYRMLTSRAEYRILFGAHTAYERLQGIATRVHLMPGCLRGAFERLSAAVECEEARLRATVVPRGHPLRDASRGLSMGRDDTLTAAALLRVQGVTYDDIAGHWPSPAALGPLEVHTLEARAKCAAYAEREGERAARESRLGHVRIPAGVDYDRLPLRHEARERLNAARPATLAQAAMLFGVTPSDIAAIAAALRRGDVSRET